MVAKLPEPSSADQSNNAFVDHFLGIGPESGRRIVRLAECAAHCRIHDRFFQSRANETGAADTMEPAARRCGRQVD